MKSISDELNKRNARTVNLADHLANWFIGAVLACLVSIPW